MKWTDWKHIKIYLIQLWQECEEWWKFVLKEMEGISKESETNRVR